MYAQKEAGRVGAWPDFWMQEPFALALGWETNNAQQSLFCRGAARYVGAVRGDLAGDGGRNVRHRRQVAERIGRGVNERPGAAAAASGKVISIASIAELGGSRPAMRRRTLHFFRDRGDPATISRSTHALQSRTPPPPYAADTLPDSG